MKKIIKIGTRSSQLAMWQAHLVQQQLKELGYQSQIVEINSKGDFVLNKPLYELGVIGVFTRNLDTAMLNGEIDIAVHSLKDVPTKLPEKIVQAAVLKRANFNDVLVYKNNTEFLSEEKATIATGSLRRKAQWLNRYPKHTIVGLRGNVNTRLKKLEENNWDGAIFAAAGLERINILPENHFKLNWMLPAPAQGAIMITALESEEEVLSICKELNDTETEICTSIEREFLNKLEGGCTAPIGALAIFKEDEISFKGALFSTDGVKKIEVNRIVKKEYYYGLGENCAIEVLNKGGRKLMLEEYGDDDKIHIFSTKVLSTSQKELFDKDFVITTSDFIKVRFNRLPKKIVKNTLNNVVITSQNAVESLINNFSKEEMSFQNIYCVGRRTKKLIEKHIGKVTHSENSSKKLADFLVENIKDKEVTYFSGNLRRDELPNRLNDYQIIVNEVEAYNTSFSPICIEENVKGVLFYSPSGVQSFMTKNKSENLKAFCIGNTTAAEARKYFGKVEVAKIPSIDSVINLVNQNKENV